MPHRQGSTLIIRPISGKMFLLIVDSHSKWVEVHVTTSATIATTIDKLQTSFAALGLPEVLVQDNGPAFCSNKFRYTTCKDTTISSSVKRPGRTLCTGIQGWYEEINRRTN